MLVLEWRYNNPIPDLKLQWVGPNQIHTSASSYQSDIETKIAVISGPRGEKGSDGEPGITTIIHEGTVPELLDGGNF